MEQTNNLYKYLHQVLTAQLKSGLYSPGQKFPSQREICSRYDVGITTVRKVLKMLDDEGYIHTAQGQPSVVTYQASKEARASFLVHYRDKIADAYRGLELLMPALYREGARRCKEPELHLLQDILNTISEDMEPADHYRLANAFFAALLRPLENHLALDLELDSENFLHVPYLPFPGVENPFATTVARTKKWFENAIYLIEQKQYDAFYDRAAQLYRESGERVDRYLCALGQFAPPIAPVEEDSHWFRTKGRSELYSRLAMTIIRRIIAGEFDGKKYLPSIPMLMEEYGVMKNTARRAMGLVNALGFAQTIDKKGTILSTRENPHAKGCFNLEDPLIQERVSLFWDALQIIALTAQSCAASISSIPKDLAQLLENRLHTVPNSQLVSVSFQLLLNSFIQLMPYHSLKNIFRQLDDVIIWGHYLQTVDESYYFDDRIVYTEVSAVVTALKRQSIADLPDAYGSVFMLFYRNIYTILSSLPHEFQFPTVL